MVVTLRQDYQYHYQVLALQSMYRYVQKTRARLSDTMSGLLLPMGSSSRNLAFAISPNSSNSFKIRIKFKENWHFGRCILKRERGSEGGPVSVLHPSISSSGIRSVVFVLSRSLVRSRFLFSRFNTIPTATRRRVGGGGDHILLYSHHGVIEGEMTAKMFSS